MSLELLALFAASTACDVGGQVAFKRGADRLPDHDVKSFAFLASLFRSPWLLAGIAIYAVEFVVWIRVLSIAPLSVAFPIASLNILCITWAGWLVFGERIGARQWLGACLVTAGIALVARSL